MPNFFKFGGTQMVDIQNHVLLIKNMPCHTPTPFNKQSKWTVKFHNFNFINRKYKSEHFLKNPYFKK